MSSPSPIPHMGSRTMTDDGDHEKVGLAAAMQRGVVVPGTPSRAASPAQPQFNHVPSLQALIGNTGIIGPCYTHILLEELPFAESRGFSRLPGSPLYRIGERWCVLTTKGKPVPGGRTTNQIAEIKASNALLDHVRSLTAAPARAEGAKQPSHSSHNNGSHKK